MHDLEDSTFAYVFFSPFRLEAVFFFLTMMLCSLSWKRPRPPAFLGWGGLFSFPAPFSSTLFSKGIEREKMKASEDGFLNMLYFFFLLCHLPLFPSFKGSSNKARRPWQCSYLKSDSILIYIYNRGIRRLDERVWLNCRLKSTKFFNIFFQNHCPATLNKINPLEFNILYVWKRGNSHSERYKIRIFSLLRVSVSFPLYCFV